MNSKVDLDIVTFIIKILINSSILSKSSLFEFLSKYIFIKGSNKFNLLEVNFSITHGIIFLFSLNRDINCDKHFILYFIWFLSSFRYWKISGNLSDDFRRGSNFPGLVLDSMNMFLKKFSSPAFEDI